MLFRNIFAFLLSAVVATASPISMVEKRGPPNKINGESGLAVVQWSTATTNFMRDYHLDADGNIIESTYASSTNTWSSKPIGFKGQVGFPLTAAVFKAPGSADNAYEIRIFYTAAGTVIDSVKFTPATGWVYDTNLHLLNIVGFPDAVVNWQASGVTQWRVYYTPLGTGAVHELAFPNDKANAHWATGNGGNAVAPSASIVGGVAALAWKAGTRISVFYFDDGTIREMRWKDGSGWSLQAVPNGDWSGFPSTIFSGELAAAGWVDAAGVDNLRLYVRWSSWYPYDSNPRLVEFQAGANGWGGQSADFPGYFVDDVDPRWPMSATAWTFPDGGNVHIRLHHPKAGVSGAIVEEVFDTGLGWRQGNLVDGQ